ncbi:MAG: VIT domain-containing protein [Kofleriaceae bacterium]
MLIRPPAVFLGLSLLACSSSSPPPVDQTAAAHVLSAAPSPVLAAPVAHGPRVVSMPKLEPAVLIARDQIAAPFTLTASDGSGLVVTRIDAKAVLEGPLAFTELHLYFKNPEPRIREGTFAITLPPGAAVSRFAMENEGQWMEAEVVEKQLARRAYEDFLHRRQDPALLEKAAGNQFTARVFPIAARAEKHLVVSFSQELPGARYVLPLRGLPSIARVDVRLSMTDANGTHSEQVLSKQAWQPDQDFVSTADTAAEALAAGSVVAVQLPALDPSAQVVDRPAAMTLLVDTSASRMLGFDRYLGSLRELIAQLAARYGTTLPLEVIAFDQDAQAIYTGPASQFGEAQIAALRARGAAGASDLGQALAKIESSHGRVVVISDGVFTAGAREAELSAAVAKLSAKKVRRLDVVLAGGIRDDQLASTLVHAGLPDAGTVLDLDRGIADVAAGLGERIAVNVAVEVAGATWVFPRTIATARSSTRTMVYARLAKPAQSIEITVGGRTHRVSAVAGVPALIERAVAVAELAELEQQLLEPEIADKTRADLRYRIATASVAHRVVSSQTAMLVLESEADYARYNIDRKALADILVVGPSGLEQTRRKLVIAKTSPRPPGRARPEPNRTADKPDADVGDLAKSKEADSARGMAGKREATGARVDDVERRLAAAAMSDGLVAQPAAEDAKLSAAAGSAASPAPAPPPPPAPPRRPSRIATNMLPEADPDAEPMPAEQRREAWPPSNSPAALTGTLATIDRAIRRRDIETALAKARAWHAKEPSNVLALIGMGEALEATRDLATAARMYGSIIDLFPARADLRRFAGERLERIGTHARALAIDSYRRAVEDRPDHLTGHRLLAYALVRDGRHAEAFAAILAGLDQRYPEDRFAGGKRVLTDDAGLIGAAYAAASPDRRAEIVAALAKRHAKLATRSSTRFILYWETDANDVDFHIQDAQGGHAYYSSPQLASGGELYADITTGYGPECFAIQGPAKAGPYRLSINYYSQGPMGYGMGLLQIVKHDGKGGLSFQDRPYVIMADHAYVDLGTFR